MIRGVPYDHELEYIEATGSQYIDIPVSASAGQYFGVSGRICVQSNTLNYMIWDSDVQSQFHSNYYSESVTATTFASSIGGVSRYGGWTVPIGVMSDFIVSTTGRTLLGEFSPLARPLTSSLTKIRLFGPIRTGNYARAAMGSFKITVGDSVVFDGIPVRVGTTALMYDRVTRTFPKHYGTFVAGPVASTPLMGVHMYGKSDYWFWPKKLVPCGSWSPTKIVNPDLDPGLDVWTYRVANNGYAGGYVPDPAVCSFTDHSVTCENIGGYMCGICRRFEPGTYTLSMNREAPVPGFAYVMEYLPSGTGYVHSGNKLTTISSTNPGPFLGKFTVSREAITVLLFGSAQRGYQTVAGPCTFTDIHINDYVE